MINCWQEKKKELYNENMEEKIWASNELKFIRESISHVERSETSDSSDDVVDIDLYE